MSGATLHMDDFRERYNLRGPCLRYDPPDNEMRRLDNIRFLEDAPAENVHFGEPPRPAEDGQHTYLWVIDDRGIPYILDEGYPGLGGERPKHTNLTGGGDAYVGGEMWFQRGCRLWVSGKSGRYGPRYPALLEDSVAVFRSYGYEVQSLGWDYEANRPKGILE